MDQARHLYEEMESNGSTKPVKFGLFEKLYPRASFKDMTQYISKLLGLAELGQVIVFPYNSGGHWVLLAIDMVRRTVYYLDPLEGSPNEELMQIVNQGIRIHQSLNSDTKANVQWIPVKCPRQPSSFECGYYVMKYMQVIVTNVNVLKNNAGVFRDMDAAAATNNEVEEGDEGSGGAGEGPSRSDDDFDGGGDNDQQIREMEAYFLA